VTKEQKAKLDSLRLKPADDLSDTEKSELSLLITIEKQAKQITEKDSLIGTKGTEIETLKNSIDSTSGSEKAALQELLATKEEALETMKIGLDALKDAQELTAASISPDKPGHGDTVDPKEVTALEAKAYADPKVRAEVEDLFKAMDASDKVAFRTKPAFKKMFLEQALGTGGDETDDTPWGNTVGKSNEENDESDEERINRLFNKQAGDFRKLPPNSSGRSGRGRNLPAMPKAAEREVDTRAQ